MTGLPASRLLLMVLTANTVHTAKAAEQEAPNAKRRGPAKGKGRGKVTAKEKPAKQSGRGRRKRGETQELPAVESGTGEPAGETAEQATSAQRSDEPLVETSEQVDRVDAGRPAEEAGPTIGM